MRSSSKALAQPPGNLGLSYIFLAHVTWDWGRHPPGMAVSQPVRSQAVRASLSQTCPFLSSSKRVLFCRHNCLGTVCVCVSVCVCLRACSVAESCTILCDPLDCSPPVSSVYGIIQERILEWAAISYSRGSSQPRDQTHISRISFTGRRIVYHCTM